MSEECSAHVDCGDAVGESGDDALKSSSFSRDHQPQIVPEAKKFQYADISPELEEKLNMMFSSTVATGSHACTPHSRNLAQECINEMTMSDGEDDATEVDRDPPSPDTTSGSESSKRMKKGKMKSTSSVLKDLVDATKSISHCLQEPLKSSCPFGIRQTLDKLGTYTEVQEDEKFYDFAITYLVDKSHRETFMYLPEGMNIKWLKNRYIRGT